MFGVPGRTRHKCYVTKLVPETMTEVGGLDSERFASILTVTDKEELDYGYSTDLPFGSPVLTTLTSGSAEALQILQGINLSRLSTKGIVDIINEYHLRELSLSYSSLSDELLKALSENPTANLETLRIEAHPESKPFPEVSMDAWFTFTNQLPEINLVVLSYMTHEDDFDPIIASYVPVTHLYLGESTPSTVVAKIGANCPRLMELVIGAYGSNTLDEVLLSMAQGCPKLSAIALGECEVTCTGFVKFVELCCKRLQVLYVWETSLLEDANYDITEVITTVSTLLGRNWEPEYVPLW